MKKFSLQESQRLFLKSVIERSFAPELEELLEIPHSSTTRERLKIYQYTYFKNHLDAFELMYPATKHAVGDFSFPRLIERFLVEYPPEVQLIHRYGEQFAEYLLGLPQKEQDAHYPSYTSDLARLEWSIFAAQFPPEGEGVDFELLATIDEVYYATIRFLLSPTLTFLESSYPLHSFWEQLKDGGTPPPPTRERTSLVVWRQQGSPTIAVLSEAEAVLLELLQQGASLENLLQNSLLQSFSLQELLEKAIRKSWITGLHYQER